MYQSSDMEMEIRRSMARVRKLGRVANGIVAVVDKELGGCWRLVS